MRSVLPSWRADAPAFGVALCQRLAHVVEMQLRGLARARRIAADHGVKQGTMLAVERPDAVRLRIHHVPGMAHGRTQEAMDAAHDVNQSDVVRGLCDGEMEIHSFDSGQTPFRPPLHHASPKSSKYRGERSEMVWSQVYDPFNNTILSTLV